LDMRINVNVCQTLNFPRQRSKLSQLNGVQSTERIKPENYTRDLAHLLTHSTSQCFTRDKVEREEKDEMDERRKIEEKEERERDDQKKRRKQQERESRDDNFNR
jgi:hypothetical protein